MAAFLPTRAPIAPQLGAFHTASSTCGPTRHRHGRSRRRLGWSAGSETAPAIAGQRGGASTSPAVPAVEPPDETHLRPGAPLPTVPEPRPLAPAPPPDRRDAPDPFVLDDDGRYLLYSTQVGFDNVPVATSRDLRHWSPPTDALPELPPWAA
jgi:hypothetical protein